MVAYQSKDMVQESTVKTKLVMENGIDSVVQDLHMTNNKNIAHNISLHYWLEV